MAAKKDYYRVLGVAETAPADEIKKAFRRLAKKYHPDVTGGDKAKEARFKEINEAYETVGDEKKRAQYDLERKNPFAGGMGPGAGPFGGGAGRNVHVDINDLFGGSRGAASGRFGDLFSELFGGGARPAPKGADVTARIEVELPVAALGGDHSILVDGKRLNVKIPPGIDDGQTIRIAGQGAPGRSGPGDLLLDVHIKPHPQFRRHGVDLEVDVPVAIDQAVLGGKVDVPTLEGKVQLTVPAGSSSGLKLRLRGKGVARPSTSSGPAARGDLYAIVQIHVPKDVPQKAKDLIAEFGKLTKKG